MHNDNSLKEKIMRSLNLWNMLCAVKGISTKQIKM
jgi:hypothetical protein